VHSKKIGTFFTAGLTHFFLVFFINIEGPLYRANRGSLQYFCIYCRAKSVDLPKEDFLDRGGTIAHDENAIGKLHGFFNVVRNEENGFLFALPDAHEIGAHFRSQEA
jgi:hypothetical protein